MIKRCILIFPSFENIDVIDKIRAEYDPLSSFIRPHITLVFPFESDISSLELEGHIKRVLQSSGPFQLTMRGFTASVEPQSNYLFLNVTDGLENLYQLSEALYTGVLEKYQSELYKESYRPHLTVGNLRKDEDYRAALNKLQNEKTTFITCVEQVNVEIIGGESSESEMMVPLLRQQ